MIIEKPAAVAAVAAAGDNRPQHTTIGTGRAVVDLAERIAGRIAALRTVQHRSRTLLSKNGVFELFQKQYTTPTQERGPRRKDDQPQSGWMDGWRNRG